MKNKFLNKIIVVVIILGIIIGLSTISWAENKTAENTTTTTRNYHTKRKFKIK